MRVVLDEDVPHQLRGALAPRHRAITVSFMGWSGVKNGALLRLIKNDGRFDAFVTGDKNLAAQQNLSDLPFAILVLSSIRWKTVRERVTAISEAIDSVRPGALVSVDCGQFTRQRKGKPAEPSRWAE